MLTKRAYKREYTDGNRVAGFHSALRYEKMCNLENKVKFFRAGIHRWPKKSNHIKSLSWWKLYLDHLWAALHQSSQIQLVIQMRLTPGTRVQRKLILFIHMSDNWYPLFGLFRGDFCRNFEKCFYLLCEIFLTKSCA